MVRSCDVSFIDCSTCFAAIARTTRSREIQAHFGLASPFGIKRHVDALTEKGALRRLDGKARGLLPQSHPRRGALAEIPLYGTIPAGLPVAAEQEPDSYISVDTVFLTPREPRPHDIVAALIDGESTLKRFLLQRGHPFLRAENPRYPDLLPATELIIQGVMIGLLRTQSN